MVEQGQVDIGRLAVVIPGKSIACGNHVVRNIVPAQQVAQVVNIVRPPVAGFAVAPIPLPVPIVMKALAQDRRHRRRTDPEVVVDMIRYRLWFRYKTDWFACVQY